MSLRLDFGRKLATELRCVVEVRPEDCNGAWATSPRPGRQNFNETCWLLVLKEDQIHRICRVVTEQIYCDLSGQSRWRCNTHHRVGIRTREARCSFDIAKLAQEVRSVYHKPIPRKCHTSPSSYTPKRGSKRVYPNVTHILENKLSCCSPSAPRGDTRNYCLHSLHGAQIT